MKVDVSVPKSINETSGAATEAEASGFDGLWIEETNHDAFLTALRASTATTRLAVGTAVAVAFARNPMTLAYSSWDLASYSEGRFILGLGSQVRPHIERRFSMTWSQPASWMRELVFALREIWKAWSEAGALDFRGEFYTHTLMTPFFMPESHPYGPPPVFLAGVGSRMTEVAGEVADGFLFHPFTTPRYLEEVTVPALRRGRASRPGGLGRVEVAGPAFCCTGRNEDELEDAIAGTRSQLAFYASTLAYRAVLETHGWGDLQDELSRLSKAGRWSAMPELISDEVLDTFAVVGDPKAVGQGLKRRWEGMADRITLYTPYKCELSTLREVADAARR